MQHYQGIYWEKGAMQGCYILFPEGSGHFCIGTEPNESNPILINSEYYIYLYITSANNGCANDYLVIEDFDGPFRIRHSGYVFDYGTECIRLL